MASKRQPDAMTKRARDLFKHELRYNRQFERDVEKRVTAYRAQTPALFKSAARRNRPRTILAEGDSWFRYVIGYAVIWHLEVLDRRRNHICNLASPGDLSSEIMHGDSVKRLERELRRGPSRNRKYDALLFSAGGNDLVGGNRFGRYLKPYTAGMAAKDVLLKPMVKHAFDLLDADYEKLIAIRDRVAPTTRIYFNAYDLAQPTGEGVCNRGPWLKPALVEAGVPTNLQVEVVEVFLRRYARRLRAIARRHNDVVILATQDTLTANEWANEIHPTKNGFRKIAEVFQAQLAADFP